MPAGDRTGPAGMGPMTGRGAGYCAGYGVPGYMNAEIGGGFGWGRGRGFGRGFGWGRGFGRGWGWQQGAIPYNTGSAPYVAPTSNQELGALKEQSQYFENALKGIQERIAELETRDNAKE